jgi:5-methyltetrahydropteroyltriglutamate--homocysteine methyltransferase
MANVYRADHVGGLIKPQALLTAHEGFQTGRVDAAGRIAAEDAAITEALAEQKAIVMTVVTDGEFRRIHADEPYGQIAGLEPRTGVLHASQSRFCVHGPVAANGRLFAAEADFLTNAKQSRFKVGLHSPGTLALRLFQPGVTDAAYSSVVELAGALAPVLSAEINALFESGVPYVQLNAPHYHSLFTDPSRWAAHLPASAASLEGLVAADAALVSSLKPTKNILALRIDRSQEAGEPTDSYERLVGKLVERIPVERYLLEYDEPAEHDFEALAALPLGKMAVLGLVRTEGTAEEIGQVIDRVEQAARKTSEDQLAVSPRRAFRLKPGRRLEEQLEAQHRSLLRASEVVQQFWGLEL